jgi:hypothetical protein
MLVSDIISQINLETGELLDDDSENIQYINLAIDFLSFQLAGIGDPQALAMLTVTDNTVVPDNFIDFIPKNGYPVNINANKFQIIDDEDSVEIKYSTALPHISSLSDTIPVKDMYISTLVLIASYAIKKKIYLLQEFYAADGTFMAQVIGSIKAAKGVAVSG